MRKLLVIAAIGAALSGCATTPQRDDQIERARQQVEQLASEPHAHDAADRDLQAAHQSLDAAEAALRAGRPPEVVHHYAYLAQRHAEAGEARVRAAEAQAEVAHATDERNRILLAQREADAQRARLQAESAQSQLAETQQQLADLKAQQTERGTVVTLGDVLFDTAAATLKPGADLSLDRLANYLRSHPGTHVRIEGHTDSRGSDAYNDALSQRRAEAVAHALEARGIPADSVEAIGRGKLYPVATNDTPAGRQQNRRVEIVFSDASGRFAQGGEAPTRR